MPSRRTCTDKSWDNGVESDLHILDQRKSKINRLKRSPKPPSQPPRTVDTSDITQPEFKTPTRPVRTKFGRLITKDSPCNDSEHQHDIIWDQSSPSPVRKDGALRGRGRRKEIYTGKTDVNDLVSRIAPKNSRPADSSDSFIQWIGVGEIPCTPEPSQPRAKAKATKKDTHDHLKELARQFDFQLTRHEGSLQNRRSAQTADQDLEDLDLFDDENLAPPPSMGPSPADAVGVLSLDLDMEEDDRLLNELFDGPTVSIENGLSQPLSGGSQNAKPAVSTSQCLRNAPESCVKSDVKVRSHAPVASTEAPRASGHVGGVGVGVGGGSGGVGGFDDDWEDDGLLDDSMVMEMTQHPDLFAPPKHCSTQKPIVGQQRVLSGPGGPTNISNQHQKYGGGSSSNRSFDLSPVKTEVKSGQANRTGVNTNQVRTSSVGGRLPSNNNNRNTLQSVQPVPCTSSDRLNNPNSKATSSTAAAPPTVTQPFTRTKTGDSVAQPCLAPHRPLPAFCALPKTSQATTWAKQHMKAVDTVQEKPTGDVQVPDGDAGIPDDDLDILFALESDWGDDVDDDDDLLCEAFDDMDKAAQGPAESAVPTSKQQAFSNGQTSSRNQTEAITSSVATVGHSAPKPSNQKPAPTFAQPVPPTHSTAYRTSGNGLLAKSAPSGMQKTAAVVAGGYNGHYHRNAVKPPSVLASAGAAASFGSSSHHTTTANHMGGASANTQTGQSSFGSIEQRNSMRPPPSTAATANQLGGVVGNKPGYNQSSVRMSNSSSSSSSSSQYSFKRLTSNSTSGCTGTTQAPAVNPAHLRCSEAEIERKKQEALERRRLRMLATQNQNQNLRAPC